MYHLSSNDGIKLKPKRYFGISLPQCRLTETAYSYEIAREQRGPSIFDHPSVGRLCQTPIQSDCRLIETAFNLCDTKTP